MPKQKITREMVVEAAFELARESGLEQVIVRDIAKKLACSVQPIYSYCQNMEGLRRDVKNRSSRFVREYIAERLDKKDFFRSTGHAYIQLAVEEPNVFRMFVMDERININSLNELYESQTNPHVAQFIAETLEISIHKARILHMNMLIYTIGMGTILAGTSPGIGEEEVNIQQELAYQAFLKQALDGQGILDQ